MPVTLHNSINDLKDQQDVYYAKCWKIARCDGTVYRFTTHSCTLNVLEDEDGSSTTLYTYTPVDAVQSSATEKRSGLTSENKQLRGILNSATISNDDLRAGLFRHGTVIEYLVDWRVPFAGYLLKSEFWINETRFTDNWWEAEITDIKRFLKVHIGRTVTRNCPYQLGDGNCKEDISSLITTEYITTVLQQRKRFRISTANGPYTDGIFTDGFVEFISGPNSVCGQFPIQKHSQSPEVITLIWEPPYDLSPLDDLTITPGCDKLSGIYNPGGDCKNTYDNVVNYGGFATMPHNDRLLRSPRSRRG